jgi:condensin complex subunit 3
LAVFAGHLLISRQSPLPAAVLPETKLPLAAPTPQATPYQTRLLSFFGTFAMEATNPDRVTFIACLLEPLVELSYSKDATARWRFCQLLHAILTNLPPAADPGDDVLDTYQAAMEERMDDGKPTIRAVAARALSRLVDPGEAGDYSGCRLTGSLLEMLAAEKSKAVRKAVLAALPYSQHTRKVFLERTRDEADDVGAG